MIHVCFALYDKIGRYSKFTGTAILSIFDNTTSEVTVHILHDNTLTQDNREKFIYLAGRYEQIIKFYNVDELCAAEIERIKEYVPAIATNTRFTIATFYRLLLPQILSADVEKIIYLDSDIVVNLDTRELWKIELDDKALAALPETEIANAKYRLNAPNQYLMKNNFVRYEDYFNAGVLVIDLNYLRANEELIPHGLKFYGEHPQCKYFDQDILNYLFSKDYVRLPAKFNRFVPTERLRRKTEVERAIYHYEDSTLNLTRNDPFNRLWLKYFIKTPWFNDDTIAHLYEGIQELHVRLKNSMINITTMMNGKTRAFFTTPDNFDALKKNFSIGDDEEIILAENPASQQKLLNAMHISRGKKVFFIFVPKFPFNVLIQAGFTVGVDFVNGFEFLSEANGLPMDSHSLIKML